MPPRILSRALLSLLALAMAACSGGAAGGPDVAATVNGVTIPLTDFQSRLDIALASEQIAQRVQGDPAARQEIETQVLSRMVEVILLEQAAADAGVQVTEEEVDGRLRDEIQTQFGGQGQYDQLLQDQGLSDDDVRTQLRALMLGERIQERIGEQVRDSDILDADIQSAYEERFTGERPVARHILLKTEEEAREVKLALDEGGDFAELAREHSADPTNANAGGLLGEVIPGELVPEFEKAVNEAEDGEIVGPVKTQFGYHLIQRLSSPPPHSLVDDGLREQLLQAKRLEAFQAFVAEQRQKAAVEVNPRFGQWDAATGRIVPAAPLGEDLQAPPPAEPQG
ncbi:MAG: peptidylprolyl isomerase [Egibacteraceae bacterium]